MARLPDTYDRRPVPQSQRGMAVFDASAVPRAAYGLGASIIQAGEEYSREHDAQAVFAARRKLDDWEQENIFDPQKGAVTLRGRDAFGINDQLRKGFDEFSGQVAGSLGTERQRRAFAEVVASRRNQVSSWADRHVLQQQNVFEEDEYQADRNNFINRAGMLALADPDKVPSEIALLQARTVGRMRALGKPDDAIQAAVRADTSAIHLAAVSGMLSKGEVLKAQNYLSKNGTGMEFDQYLKAKTIVDQEVDNRVANMAATTAVQNYVVPKMLPTDGDRLVNLVAMAESGNRELGPDGKVLTSPKGAKGSMQVLDATNKDPGLGVKPAQDDSLQERARVGRDYLGALLKRYDGDLSKALGAYNWGMAKVDSAVKKAEGSGDKFRPAQPGDWLVYAPAETQQYVAKITKAYADGQGVPTPPTLQDVHNSLRSVPELANNPRRLKVALDASTAQYNDAIKAKKDAEEQAVATAMQAVMQTGGKWTDVPQDIRARVPADKVDSVMNFGTRYAKGNEVTNPAVYLRLTDPARLKSLSDAQFFALRSELTQQDFEHFAQQRNKADAKGTSPGDLDAESVNATLKARLESIGIEANPKSGDDVAVARISTIQKFVRSSVLSAQQSSGKKFNDAEIEKHIDGLFAKSVPFRNTFMGFNTGGVTNQRLLAMKPGDIPGDVRNEIEADFRSRGIEPTDGDVLGAYLQLKTLPRRGATGAF